MSYQLNSQCWEICLSQGIYPKNIVLFLDMVVQRVVETDENMLIGKVLTLEPCIISTHISYLHLKKDLLDNKNKHDTEAMETNHTVSYTIDRNISISKIKRGPVSHNTYTVFVTYRPENHTWIVFMTQQITKTFVFIGKQF